MKMPSRVVRTIAVFASTFSLAACGGGGGAAGGGAVPQATPAPPQITKTQSRAAMQSSLTMLANANGATIGGTGTLAVVRRVEAIRRGRRVQTIAGCVNGATSTTVTNPDGSTTQTDNAYYDVLCATIEESDVVTVSPGASLQNLAAAGTVTTYARSGAVTSYTAFQVTVAGTATQDTITIAGTVAATIGGTPYGKVGVTCIAPLSGTSIHCGTAAVNSASGQQLGVSLDESAAFTTNGTSSTVTATAGASAYAAASGLDIAAGAPPAWSVTGAAPFETVTGSLTLSYSPAAGTSGSIVVTDVTDAISVGGYVTDTTVTLTGVARGVTIAAVAVDAVGNGTITYADGTTAAIAAWTISG